MRYDLNISDAVEKDGKLKSLSNETGFGALLSAYSNSVLRLSPEWTLNAGINAQLFTLNGNYSIEPRIGF